MKLIMKNLLLLTCTVFLSLTVSIAQNTKTFVCSYHGTPKYSKADICGALGFTSNRAAEDIVDNILKQVGLKRNFIVMECPETDNCFAVTLPSDIGLIRYIIYDNKFLESLEGSSNETWASKSILAHEIAHHLNGHTLDILGSRPSKELEADEFSGFVLAKLGATLEQAQSAIKKVGSEYATSTHPAKADRLIAIKKGWGEGLKNSKLLKASNSLDEKINLGIVIDFEYNKKDGVMVDQIIKASPAHKTGLQKGDRIIKIGEIGIKNSNSYYESLAKLNKKQRGRIAFVRGKKIYAKNLKF